MAMARCRRPAVQSGTIAVARFEILTQHPRRQIYDISSTDGSETSSTPPRDAGAPDAVPRPIRSNGPGPAAGTPPQIPIPPATLGRAHQIAQLSAHQRPRSPCMLPRHQLVPERSLLPVLNEHQLQVAHSVHRIRHLDRLRHRTAQASWPAAPHPPPRHRQPNLPVGLQLPECFQTAAALGPTANIVKSKFRADSIRQRRPVRELLPFHQAVQAFQLAAQGALDLVLNYHVVQTTIANLICSALLVGIGES